MESSVTGVGPSLEEISNEETYTPIETAKATEKESPEVAEEELVVVTEETAFSVREPVVSSETSDTPIETAKATEKETPEVAQEEPVLVTKETASAVGYPVVSSEASEIASKELTLKQTLRQKHLKNL